MAEYSLGTAHGTVKIDSDTSGVDKANTALGGLDKNAQQSGMSIDQVGNRMGIAGLAIAGGFGVAVNTAASFEQKLSGIKAVSGATAAEMDLISDAALRIGKDTAFSASEAAGAMEELSKAGISTEDILGGVADATVALAAATGIELPAAATYASDTMNMFNLGAGDMNNIVDTLAQTANASSIDMNDLGMAMSQVGAVANLAGLSVDDTAIAIGLMGDAGIKGSDAGTSLKTMLMNLQPSTEAQAKAMQELGLITEDGTNQFYDANGELKSLRDVQEILQTSTEGLTAAEKQMALETIFGSDAIRAAAVMADAGAEGFDAFAVKMEETGSAADQAKIRQDNLRGGMEELKGSLETAGIMIGTILIPALRAIVDFFTELLAGFLELDAGTQKWIVGTIGAVGALLLLGAGIIKTVAFFKSMHAALVTLRIISTATQASFLATAATAVTTAARTAAAWVLSAAQTVAAWVAAGVKMVAQWLLLGAQAALHALKVAAAWLVTAGTAAATAVLQTTTAVVSMLAQWLLLGLQSMLHAAKVVAAWVLTSGPALAAAVLATGTAIATMLAGWLLLGIQSLARAAMVAAAWLIAMGPVGWAIALFALIVGVVILFWDDIVAFFKAGAEKVSEWMQTAWQWIQDAWDSIVEAFRAAGEWIAGVMEDIVQWISNAWGNVVRIFQNAGQAVWAAMQQVGQWVAQGAQAVVNFFVNMAQGIWNAMQQAWNWIVSVWNNIISFIQQIPGWIAGVFASAGSWLIGAGQSIVSGLANGIYGAISWVWNGLLSIWSSVTSFFSGAGSWLVSAGKNIVIGLWNGIASLAGWLWNKAVSWARSIWDGVTSFFGISSPSRLFHYMGEMLMLGMAGGVESEGDQAVNAATDVARSVVGAMQDGLAEGASLSATVGAALTEGTLGALAGSGVNLGSNVGTAVSSGVGFSKSSSQSAIDKEFGRMVSIEMNTYNPVAEKASDSEARKLRAAAAVGAF